MALKDLNDAQLEQETIKLTAEQNAVRGKLRDIAREREARVAVKALAADVEKLEKKHGVKIAPTGISSAEAVGTPGAA